MCGNHDHDEGYVAPSRARALYDSPNNSASLEESYFSIQDSMNNSFKNYSSNQGKVKSYSH